MERPLRKCESDVRRRAWSLFFEILKAPKSALGSLGGHVKALGSLLGGLVGGLRANGTLFFVLERLRGAATLISRPNETLQGLSEAVF